ncbi:LytTR family DNA-binding domain-containing protein [Hymenobacter actinosclerus]|uniref:LytTR family DNA-binding domain-containing protein n=1 Tax=Hymenobacter actinosclerus TaxID=82805 RepID=UPI00373FC846
MGRNPARRRQPAAGPARLAVAGRHRANRQQIINLNWVESIEPWFSNTLKIRLRGGPEVEVSRQQSGRFRELLSL